MAKALSTGDKAETSESLCGQEIASNLLRSTDEFRLNGWTQEELANKSNINATNISILEHNRIDIGKKQAEQLAKAFEVHPAIIMFPEYESKAIQQAA